MTKATDVVQGSDNVFADLGVAEPEETLAKAELARRISEIIRRRRLTQRQTATLLGVDQPKVSALMRGQLYAFSTDRLLRFLTALDRDVEIVIKPKAGSRARVIVLSP